MATINYTPRLFAATVAAALLFGAAAVALSGCALTSHESLDLAAERTGYATTAGSMGAGLSAGNAPCTQPIPATPYGCR
jgi:hypothetical protein